MPDGWIRSAFPGKAAVALGVGLCLFGGVASASPDWDLIELRAQLSALSESLRADSQQREKPVTELIGGLDIPELAGLEVPAAAQPAPGAPVDMGWVDKRHSLAAMAQIYGGQDNRDVMEAGRANDTEALEIRSGVVTLNQLRERLTARHLGRDIETGADILRVPLVIGRDATLRLAQDELLLLGQREGAFIVNFGRLEVFGAEISADRAHDETAEDFSPFIATVGSGTVRLSGATFRRLGFGYTAKFAGFSILAHPTMLPDGRNLIENSRFDDLVTVALVGARHVEVRGNRFFDMRRNPLLVSRSPDAVVEANLFSGDTPTNAVRVANGSVGSRIERNIVLEGARAGLLVSSGSDNVTVARNLVWRRNGGGIKLFEVTCGRVELNLILDDRQKGIEVRSSRDALLRHNRIIGNHNAGVWVSANTPDTQTYVLGNLLRENGSGISAASGGSIALSGNDLSNQFPRFLDGDITHQFRAVIQDLHGKTPIFMDSGGVRLADRLTPDSCEG